MEGQKRISLDDGVWDTERPEYAFRHACSEYEYAVYAARARTMRELANAEPTTGEFDRRDLLDNRRIERGLKPLWSDREVARFIARQATTKRRAFLRAPRGLRHVDVENMYAWRYEYGSEPDAAQTSDPDWNAATRAWREIDVACRVRYDTWRVSVGLRALHPDALLPCLTEGVRATTTRIDCKAAVHAVAEGKVLLRARAPIASAWSCRSERERFAREVQEAMLGDNRVSSYQQLRRFVSLLLTGPLTLLDTASPQQPTSAECVAYARAEAELDEARECDFARLRALVDDGNEAASERVAAEHAALDAASVPPRDDASDQRAVEVFMASMDAYAAADMQTRAGTSFTTDDLDEALRQSASYASKSEASSAYVRNEAGAHNALNALAHLRESRTFAANREAHAALLCMTPAWIAHDAELRSNDEADADDSDALTLHMRALAMTSQ